LIEVSELLPIARLQGFGIQLGFDFWRSLPKICESEDEGREPRGIGKGSATFAYFANSGG
jgi:hypothetical protein